MLLWYYIGLGIVAFQVYKDHTEDDLIQIMLHKQITKWRDNQHDIAKIIVLVIFNRGQHVAKIQTVFKDSSEQIIKLL